MATKYKRPQIGYDGERLTRLHWFGVVLAAITGTVHLYLFVDSAFVGFLVASVVFYAAIGGVLLNVYPRILYVLGVPFTAGQILFWLAADTPYFALGVADKVVQLLLIATLVLLFRWEGEQRSDQADAGMASPAE